MRSERQLVSLDWAMKKLLRSKANYAILEGFLSELLFDDITIKEILESEANQENQLDKFNRVDIMVTNSKGELIIIEIQFNSERDYFHRILYGASKAIVERMELTEPWSQVKKVISVNIVYFDLGRGEDYIYHGKTEFKGLHAKDHLQLSPKQRSLFKKNYPEEIFPDYFVIKVNKFDNNAKNTLDQWVYFLKNEEIKESFNAKGLKEAKKKLSIMKLPKSEQLKYQKYVEARIHDLSEAETMKQDIDFAKKEGIEQGIEQERRVQEERRKSDKIETAKKMLLKKFDIETISELTGLSIKEIQKLS